MDLDDHKTISNSKLYSDAVETVVSKFINMHQSHLEQAQTF